MTKHLFEATNALSVLNHLDFCDIPVSSGRIATPTVSVISKTNGFMEMLMFKNTGVFMEMEMANSLKKAFVSHFKTGEEPLASILKTGFVLPAFDRFHTVLIPVWKSKGLSSTLDCFRRITFWDQDNLKQYHHVRKNWALEWGFDWHGMQNGTTLHDVKKILVTDPVLGEYDVYQWFHSESGRLVFEEYPEQGLEIFYCRGGEIRKF